MKKIDRTLCPYQEETMHLYGPMCANKMIGIRGISKHPNGNYTGTDYEIHRENFCEKIEDFNCPWVMGKRIERLEQMMEERYGSDN